MGMEECIRVLHVDDKPDLAEMTATYLARVDDGITVETATSGAEGFEQLSEAIDCVVSDYDMPGMNGIEFLEAVRGRYPDLPFILFTGKGSEEVASDAISAGVTDYLQKETGTDQYAVLANRVTNAVAQVRAEHQVQEERQRFQILFDRLTQPTVEVEYESEKPVVQQVNSAFEEVFGYDAADIVGSSLDDYIVPESKAEQASQINQRVQAGGGLNSLEVTRRTADGNREFLLQNAVYDDGSGGFAIYTEITSRKRREQRLERLAQRSNELINTTDKEETGQIATEIASEVVDAPLASVHLCSEDGTRFEGVAANDDVRDEMGVPPTYHREDDDTASELVCEAYDCGEQIYVEDVRNYGTLAEETPATSAIVQPLVGHGVFILSSTEADAFDEPERNIIELVAQSVTASLDRVERETDLRQRERGLQRERDRLERFTSVVSHDLRSPLNVVGGRIELARAEHDSLHLRVAADAVDRMETLISDILTVAREGEAVQHTEPVSLPALASECWTRVETSDATLVTAADQTVSADPGRLKQLFENLINNSVEHNEREITVTVGDLEDGFYVADDGRGVPADEREDVFESGYSTRDGGTGFGLNIVREVAEAHGWNITLTASDTGGVRFELTDVDIVD